jgi:hypothetical protein
MNRTGHVVCLLFLLPGSAAMADILWMRNGDRLSGTIEEITDEQIRIKPAYSQAMTVPRHAIKRWRLDKQETKPLTKTGIPLLDSPDEANAWLLTGNGDLNIKLKENTKKTNNVNLGLHRVCQSGLALQPDGEYIYETANNITDSHEYKLKPKLDFFFDDHWFLRSSVDIDYNMIDAGYLEIDCASGPGYRFWNDRQRRLELITSSVWNVPISGRRCGATQTCLTTGSSITPTSAWGGTTGSPWHSGKRSSSCLARAVMKIRRSTLPT